MVLVFVLIFSGLGFLIVKNNKVGTQPISKEILVRPASHSTGDPNAKVNLVEFGDFQCPACAAAAPIIKEILNTYKDNPNFNFVSRNFPLTSIHQNALISAQAAEAAGGQGKYWEMYDLLYENQNEWAKSTDPLAIFAKYATGLKIDVERFKNEVQSGAYQNIINQDLADARSLGINSTPTFFLNGVKMLGVQNIEDLKARINQALAE